MAEPQLKKTRRTTKKKTTVPKKLSTFWSRLRALPRRVHARATNFLSRRPHRTFRLTKRRDSKRSLAIPGYWKFTFYVAEIIRRRWKVFLGLTVLYTILSIIFGSMTDQDTYRQIGSLLEQTAPDVLQGSWGTVGQAGILIIATFTGGTTSLTEIQQIYVAIIVLLTWLTSVWLLREILAGRRPKLRDGLYSASSPLLSTALVFVYLLVQLLPMGLTVVVYTALSTVGVVSEGFGIFIFSMIAVLVAALTLYWMTATFIALVVVTLPGMYPGRAIKIAGDLVVGRRLRIILRILWMVGIALLLWLCVMVPLVISDTWLSSHFEWGWLNWLPVVPFVATFMSSVTAVWFASYIYLLYRKVVDDDAAPA